MAQSPDNPPDTILEAEEEDYNDSDSGFGSVIGSSTASLASSILKHREENGRTYHAYKEERNYVLPNDELENDRLDLQNHIFLLTLENKLFTCPAKKFDRVLDVGTGTGIWAIDFADEHPEAEVIGVDLSPIQPLFVPSNVKFQIDDVEEEWTYSSKFDFINVRMMTGHLNPGGYVEISDIIFPITADDGTLSKESALARWSDLMLKASLSLNRSLESAKMYRKLLEGAGFTDLEETEYKWPQNRWPRGKRFKELGMWTLENISTGLEGLSLALFTRGLQWSKEELEVFLVDVRKDMKNTRIHSYWPIRVTSARKPL
ncbi:S-adenosyl-L-methionine-dependent methyltransferase-5 [Coleophoma crateriformis]|uniref:S-adenosyl-L-methionine-dependent methyltransferase-5 n=1 Tax=Coleophoma crateriformis TaxID=565419 RepID=A0A3D8RID8_9HELO|nr:S-adenosyl-L-methionine-dependent methyltransferase-5 [Coleophoma crateriformis]